MIALAESPQKHFEGGGSTQLNSSPNLWPVLLIGNHSTPSTMPKKPPLIFQ